MGRYRTAQTWKIIAMFYSDGSDETGTEGAIPEHAEVSDGSMHTLLDYLLKYASIGRCGKHNR